MRKNSKIREIMMNLVGGMIGSAIILGIFAILGWFVEWIGQNQGRTVAFFIIGAFILGKCLKNELDK